jgi:hypothetical protein
MDLQSVRVIREPLNRATHAEVDAAEERLWTRFPAGYREYVTTLGEGTLGGAFVRIHPPWRIERELREWRARIAKYWFWDQSPKLLSKERAAEMVLLGDTVNGDELVFHPGRPDRLFVLPRDSQHIYECGKDLLSAVEWMCSSGKLTEAFAQRDFEPLDTRKQKAQQRTAGVEDEETLEASVAALQKWADRRGLSKAAQKAFAEWLKGREEPLRGLHGTEVPTEAVKGVPKDQVLVFRPEKYSEPCVVTTLTMVDAATRAHIGEFELLSALDGSMLGYSAALRYDEAAALAENWLAEESAS